MKYVTFGPDDIENEEIEQDMEMEWQRDQEWLDDMSDRTRDINEELKESE